MPGIDLDLAAARAANELGARFANERRPRQEVEKLIGNAMAVLSQAGPYALFLYLASQNPPAAYIAEWLFALLHRELQVESSERMTNPERLRVMADLAMDLDRLLVARKLLMQALTYARYHAKCLEDRTRPRRGAAEGARA